MTGAPPSSPVPGAAQAPGNTGRGDMPARLRSFDWSATPLGPMDDWPQALKVAVGICLCSRFPMFVWWGPDLINIYNDAYAPMLGKRHPDALGRPARLVWGDIWDVVGPQAEAVMTRGEATWNERVRLVMERNGYVEDTWFTWSYSPIPDGAGGIGGLFCACTEETPRVLIEAQRDRLLAQLDTERSRLADVFHRSPSFTAVLSGPDHVFELVNDRYTELIGRRNVIGLPVREALPEVEGQGFFELLDRVYASGEPFVGQGMSVRLQRRAGGPLEERYVEFVFQARRNADGAVSGIFCHGIDLTERRRAEQGLRASEQQMRLLTDALPALIGYVGADQRYRFNNRTYADWVGAGPGALAGKHLRDVLGEDEYRQRLPFVEAALRGETVRFEAASRHVRKGVVDAEFLYVPDRAADGGVNGFVVLVQDVSERKAAELEARLIAERYRMAARATNDAVWDWDLSADAVQWSEAVETLFGHRLAGLRSDGAWWKGQVHPDDRDGVVGSIQSVIGGGSTHWRSEYRFRRADGTYADVLDRGYMIRDAQGRPSRMVGAITDLTERKRIEAELRRGEERLAQAVSIAQLGTFDIDLATDSVTVNEAGRLIYGWPAGEPLTFAKVQTHFHPEDRAYVVREVGLAFDPAGPGEFEVEQRIVRVDGATRWIRVRGRALFDVAGGGRRAARCVGTYLDVTDQKEAEHQREQLLASERAARAEAERASEAKSQFLATLSHELRTPLTPVLLTVSLMEMHPGLPEDLREDVATIRRNVELESRLIADLLDLTRITSGKLQLDEQDVDLHAVVRAAIDICQREASARLVVELNAGRHRVRGDATRLQQIFWNIVSNAAKFTPPHGLITVRSSDAPGGRVRVEVTDTGAGIDPEVLPKLFNAFEQGDVRAGRQQAGLGLGLAISRRLAEAHGGTIVAHSEGRGRGATFTVELPAAHAPAPEARPRGGTPSPAAGRPMHVLVVEDHEPTLMVMSKLLRGLGHQVTSATTVATAAAAARQNGFDLIISDLGLPDGSGLDVMRQVRERYAGRAIALTGYGMESDIAASREAGFAEHLTKPVDMAALEAAIRRVGGTGARV